MKITRTQQCAIIIKLLLIGVLVFSLFSSLTYATQGSWSSYSYNGRTYKLYVPTGYQSSNPTPLMVMLHGCTQDADQFATGTRMNEFAETHNFIVLYPEQTSSENQNKCWNWFELANQSRGSGEPALIVGMVNQVKSNYTIDNSKVFVQGFSAGGAMSVILGATYPDVFSGIGVHSGLEYKAATSMISAFTAMNTGGPDPVNQGRLANNAMGNYECIVPTIVFHGSSDYTVATINGHQVLTQWATTNDLADNGSEDASIDDIADRTTQDQVSGGKSYTKYEYDDNNGNLVMEKYIVDGMGHAWSGGNVSGSYTEPGGPNATQLSWDFFMEVNGTLPIDTTAPVTSAIPEGSTYTNPVTVSLSVNEPATTYYTTDGTTPTTNSATYSESITISETTTLKFFSVDTAGNVEQVKTQVYTIENTTGDITAPITTATPTGGTYNDPMSVTLSVNESAVTYYTTDGTTPSTSSTIYSEAITISETTTLKFFSVDTAGNAEQIQTLVYTIEPPISSETVFKSIGVEDGFVGALSLIDGLSTSVSKLGDKGMFNTDSYRTVLSFDTSSIGSNTITGAKLRIYRKVMTGTINSIKIDIKYGTFGTSALEPSDYSTTPSAADIIALTVPSVDNAYSEAALPVYALQHINPNGKTQIRLSASTPVDFASDVLEIYGGEDETYAAQLIIITN